MVERNNREFKRRINSRQRKNTIVFSILYQLALGILKSNIFQYSVGQTKRISFNSKKLKGKSANVWGYRKEERKDHSSDENNRSHQDIILSFDTVPKTMKKVNFFLLYVS